MRRLLLSCAVAFGLLVGVFVLAQAKISNEPMSQVVTTSGTALAYQADGLDLTYTVIISDPVSRVVHIQLDVGNVSTDTLSLARKKEDLLPAILNLTVTNQYGDGLPYSLDDSLSYVELMHVEASDTSTITVLYDADLPFTDCYAGQSFWVLDSSYGLVGSHLIFYQPVADTEIRTVRLDFDLPEGWDAITRFHKADARFEPNQDDVVTYWEEGVEFPFFIWGPMAFGDFDTHTRTVGGIDVLVAFYSDDDAEEPEIAERVFTTIDHGSHTLGALPEGTGQGRFVYVFHDKTHGHVHGGDHQFGQITVMDNGSGVDWYSMAHMIFHNWFVVGPEERLWREFHVPQTFSEGLIQFFALQSVKDTSIWDTRLVDDLLQNWYTEYVAYIQGTEYDVPITSNEWGTFPHDIWKIGMYKEVPLVFYLLDWKIEDVTYGEKSFDDAWQLLHDQRPGYSELKGGSLTFDDILEAVNYSTGHDFSDFWEAYISSTPSLPFHIVNGWLTVDTSAVPDAPVLSDLELVRLSLRWNRDQSDTDGDGLSDYVEELIGTNPQMVDTDQDGLGDRGEFGVIVDGQPGEYYLDRPLITDPQGDSLSSEAGTDINEIHAKTFLNENGNEESYLVLSTWDNQCNPDAWYEIFLKNDGHQYKYRLDHGSSYLWHKEDDNPQEEIPTDGVDVRFEELLEVMIPLELLPQIRTTITVGALIRYGQEEDPSSGLKNVDPTDWATTSAVPQIFITDPLNPDTDGDGVSDGLEVLFGSDPTDASDTVTVWLVSLPIVLRSHPETRYRSDFRPSLSLVILN